MKDLTHYGLLAEMFRYPSSDMKAYIGKWTDLVASYDHELAGKLEPFLTHIREQPLSLQQEYYVGTFDIQPVSSLDVGYILFGEDYRRGLFLVNIKKEQLKAGNDCGSELPDHLPNMLTLLPKMQEEELAEELICSLLISAVQGMSARFRGGHNLYQGLLDLLVAVMEKDYPSSKYERFDSDRMVKTDLLGKVSQETRIMD